MTLKCPICGEEFERMGQIRKHLMVDHEINSICPICGKKVRSIKPHLRLKGDEKHYNLWIILARPYRSYLKEEIRNEIRKLRY